MVLLVFGEPVVSIGVQVHQSLLHPSIVGILDPLVFNANITVAVVGIVMSVSWKDKIKKYDAHSSVSNEFRVSTLHGAVLSVVTVSLILYFVITEISYNFQTIHHERVHVNVTNNRGLEMEFDITLPAIPCTQLQIDANDHHGQSQSLHLDQQHHVWKHRVIINPADGSIQLIGQRSKLELGSTLKNERQLIEYAASLGKIGEVEGTADSDADTSCGSCYGAGEEGECCNTCEDVRRAYKRRGWVIKDDLEILQCKKQIEQDQEGEGCNVHGVVALSTGGGNLHLAPGKDSASEGFTILDMLMQSFQKWNVSHTVNKIRFGPEYPAMTKGNQLDGKQVTIEDTYGMYQYYFQVRADPIHRYVSYLTWMSLSRLSPHATNSKTGR
jgi:endoplasmic reticulum-Golgi intermediate compartment protein 3